MEKEDQDHLIGKEQERNKKEKDQQIKMKKQKGNKVNKNQGQFASLIIQIMKKTKKNSPLFKPVKKLKTSIQSIGQERISFYQQTNSLAVFHFGLGGEVDKEIIINGLGLCQKKDILKKQFVILPGKSFSFMEFVDVKKAKQFIQQNEMINILDDLKKSQDKQKMNVKKQIQNETEQKLQQKLRNNNNQSPQHQPLFYYKQVQYNNLNRLMIFLYLKSQNPTKGQIENPLINISNCDSKYNKNNQISGLKIIQQLITKQQQLDLLKWIDQHQWQKLSNRRVQHYGYEFKYGKNNVDKQEEGKHKIPEVFGFILDRVKKIVFELSKEQIQYDQLTINDYFAGDGIPAHFDTHSPFQEYFVAISMLSGIVMDWRRYDNIEVSTYLKQRSMVVFSGQARYAWLHSIACRKLDKIDNQLKHRSRRISLTFRKIKKSPCTCKYNFFCDSQGYDQQTMKKNNPLLTKYLSLKNKQKINDLPSQKLYNQYVIKAYNSFGYDFHNKVIPQIKQYLDTQTSEINISTNTENQSKLVLDIGCGNGQYKKYLQSQKFYYIGIERCQIMIPVQEEMHMDGRKLGFKEDTFDIVLLIAVLHHFTTQDDRLKCLKQARRVLKAETGVLYLTVFNFQGKQNEYSNQDILLDYCLPNHKLINQNGKPQNQEVYKDTPLPLIPKNLQKQQGISTQKGQIFQRYYHLFTVKQIQNLLQKVGLKIEQIKTSKENIIVKISKPFEIKQ